MSGGGFELTGAGRVRAIVEFRSVVDAVNCAIEIQRTMVERNAEVAPDKRIEFRVGVHLGDVVEESDGDLMGDGVNIACAAGERLRAGGIRSRFRRRSNPADLRYRHPLAANPSSTLNLANAKPRLRPLHLVVRETEFCGLRLAGDFGRRTRENGRNSVRRPPHTSLTDRNCEGFCRPGNRVGLPGLHGGGRSRAKPVSDGVRSLVTGRNTGRGVSRGRLLPPIATRKHVFSMGFQ